MTHKRLPTSGVYCVMKRKHCNTTLRLLLLAGLLIGLVYQPAQAQSVSNCDRALGEAYLDVNNVRARILNGGGLFYRGEPHVYEVPKGSGSNAIFASGIWLAGQVGGQLRAAATRYGEWEFWAGPLDENGNAPTDCSVFDRVFKVSRHDVEEYEATGAAIPNLRDWPTGLGAPTLAPPDNGIDDDEDGEIDEQGELIRFDITVPLAQRLERRVNLAGGERPALLGDQSIWWVMNDRGNSHGSTGAPAVGVEVHGIAFAFNTAGDIGNTTFYKYNIFYKGNVPLENAYLGIFSDPDLGDFADDFVGSDTTLGVGYVYNSDNEDISGEGYGTPPPAAGYDFFQGPIVPSVGDTAKVSGRLVPGFRNLGMTHFVYYNNGGCVICDPSTGEDYYNYMRGRWKDGQPVTFGGNGRDFSTTPVDFMYAGDPVTGQGWSEFNPAGDGSQPAIDPGDRRFVMSTGPFTINPGDQQEIVFGLVWAIGADNLDSVTKLRQADALAQAAFDVNFELPSPPAAPAVSVTELDGQVILEWSNSARSNNYLESYNQADPFAPDEDKNYEFEGYEVIRYADVADQTGTVIATYDVSNGVTRVIDGVPGEPTGVTAVGTDAGVQTYHVIGSLTNYQTYYFGVQAYAYNEPSFPKVYRGPVARVEVVPTRSTLILSDDAIEAAGSSTSADFTATRVGAGEGRVWADIVNPARVTGDVYTIEFYEIDVDCEAAAPRLLDSPEEPDGVTVGDRVTSLSKAAECRTETTYDIKRGSQVVFDGAATGAAAPQREKLVIADGLLFSVVGPEAGIKGFAVTSNAAGPLDPWDMGAFAFNNNGFPTLEGNGVIPAGSHPAPDRPTAGYQQTDPNVLGWGIHTGGNFSSWNSWLDRTIIGRNREVASVGSNDYEWRFTQRCFDGIDGTVTDTDCLAWRNFEDGALVEVPFEVWNVGPTDDPSDDFRMVTAICEAGCGGGTEEFKFDLGVDHPVSGGADDPHTDWIYWYTPDDTSPGEAGYECFFFGPCSASEMFARTVLVNWGGGEAPPYTAALPEVGTTFRIVTFKPSQPGDVFTLSTEGFGAQAPDAATAAAQLDEVGIVPNPYKGASTYERSQLIDEVRFTNLPEVATIRIFTLNGALIKTIEKNGPERYFKWNLTTDNNLPIASGVYLIHVEAPGIGERVLKFSAIKKRVHLNVF